jgi:multidrug efflux pump subunit AcrB
VALVEDGFEDVNGGGALDGEPAQGLGVRKQRGANAVPWRAAVRAKVAEIRKSLPEGMKVESSSTRHLHRGVGPRDRARAGPRGLLTALVCWLFLGSLSSTLNVVLAIPMSLLGTIGVIYFLGFTLNTFTLLALSLAVGLVVDDAIMVLENIYRHARWARTASPPRARAPRRSPSPRSPRPSRSSRSSSRSCSWRASSASSSSSSA